MFQSSPSPKTGRYDIQAVDYPVTTYVPILTQSENWALFTAPQSTANMRCVFQSSPSPKTGRYAVSIGFAPVLKSVPILTQSENWALL